MGRAVKLTIFLSLLCLFLGFYLGQSAGAGTTPLPGSEEDPLVTRSWVVSYLNQVLGGQGQQAGSLPPAGELPAPASMPRYRVVELQPGQQLLLGESSEMVLRVGKATALEGQGGGLSDLTEGKNIAAGQTIPRDHLILSPRDDGRGLAAHASTVVLVRGNYRIK